MNQDKGSFWYSWPAVILALWLFWPVGIFLLIKKLSRDKKAAMGAGKLIGGFGIAAYCIAGIGLFASISNLLAGKVFMTGEDIVMILFFGGAGFALRKIAKKIKSEAESVKQYLSIIVNGGVRQLDTIASTTGKSYDVVHKDVKKMIEKGYLKNAYIDEGMREVVLPSSAPAAQNTATAVPTANAAPVQTKIVACPCCGANNTIQGETGECEYCGSPLK